MDNGGSGWWALLVIAILCGTVWYLKAKHGGVGNALRTARESLANRFLK